MNEKVREFMIPIQKFPMILDSASFAGAVMALEQANTEFMSGKREQRILLVCNKDNKVIGKLSPIDVVRGLEPNYDKLIDKRTSSFVSGFDYVIESMKEQAVLWSEPLKELCMKAQDVQIKSFIKSPSSTQVVQANDDLNEAFHKFVIYRHDSLFVKEGEKLVGLIRFSDVWREIIRRIRDVCRL